MAHGADKRKQSLYFSEEMLREIQGEATRQDRSLSWIMQHAWRAARGRIGKLPGTDDRRPAGADGVQREDPPRS
jgi:uncharacterized small protein (TIGR04563 family)